MERRLRVREGERFRQVRQAGASQAHPLMILSYLRNDCGYSRCGFTVNKRIGKAVERNRARRRMTHALRSLLDLVEPGWDLIWIARPGINEAEFTELQDACARLLRRAHLLRE